MEDILTRLRQARSDEEREWLVMQLSLDNMNAELREAVWAASILRWFDAEYLKATLNNSAFDRFDDLIHLSFVEPFENRGYNIHERSHKLLEKHLWDERPEYYRQLSQRASAYCFSQDLEDTGWMIEYICHLLVAEPERGVNEFRNICTKWYNPPLFADEKIEALTRSVREREHATLDSPDAMCYCLYWEAKIDYIKSRFPDALEKVTEIKNYDIKDQELIADSAFLHGNVEQMQAGYDIAKTHYQHALSIYQQIGGKLGEANILGAQGDIERLQAEYHAAKTHYQHALLIYQQIGDKRGEANTLGAQGDVERMQAEYHAAKTHYQHALLI